MTAELTEADRARLLSIARQSVRAAAAGRSLSVDLAEASPALRSPGASFVTLRRPDGELRGCIGTILPTCPLAEDVATNAARAASSDPRFRPVSAAEAETLAVSVAVLSPFAPIAARSEAELLATLRPGIDGLLLRDRGRHALFLPQVWDQVPSPEAFLRALKRKAGLPPGPLSPAFEAERFTVQPIGK